MLDSYPGIILAFTALNLPLAVFFYVGFIGAIPRARTAISGGGAGIGLGILRMAIDAGGCVIGFDIDSSSEARAVEAGASFQQVDVGNANNFVTAINNDLPDIFTIWDSQLLTNLF